MGAYAKLRIEISEATSVICQVRARWCHNTYRTTVKAGVSKAHNTCALLAKTHQHAPEPLIDEH